MTMNILRLVYEWPPPWDGLTPGPYELTRAQLKLGHKVVVFCGGRFRGLGRAKEAPGDSPKSGFKTDPKAGLFSSPGSLGVYRFPRALKRFSIFLTTAPAVLLGYLWLRLTGRGPDLVHGHGHITLWFNLYKLLFGWLDKMPYVLHLHITAAGREKSRRGKEFGSKASGISSKNYQNLALEPNFGELPNSLDFWTKYFEWPLHKFSDWLGVRVADRVVCVSSRVRDEAIEFYGADSKKLVVIENGVNTTLFTPLRHSEGVVATEESPSERSFAPPSRAQDDDLGPGFDLLYVGALQPRKNAHLLIRAFRFLPDDYHLTIVGRGDEEYEDKLRHLVRELRLKGRVKFEGYVEYPQLPSFYQRASIFVLPSSYEGMPKVVLEALACGVPVLASGFDAQNPIGGLEFVKNLDPESLAKRIQEVLDSVVEVDVSKVAEFYSWDREAQELEDMYQSL